MGDLEFARCGVETLASRARAGAARWGTIAAAVSLVGILQWFSWSAPPARAATTEFDPNSTFCASAIALQFGGVMVNIDYPEAPFFNDGNADGIADALQVDAQRSNLPQLASSVDALSQEAPGDLAGPLSQLASEIAAVAAQPAPTSAAESEALTAPIESLAAQLQPMLASCHVEDDGTTEAYDAYAEAAAERAEQTAQGIAWRLTLGAVGIALCVLAILPLILVTVRMLRPIIFNETGTAFSGFPRKWQLRTITGIVAGTSDYAITTHSGQVLSSGQVNFSSHTTVREQLRLVLADGFSTDVSLTDFEAFPVRGDAVSVCIAQKGSTSRVFALLNHTTRQSKTQPTEVLSLRIGGTGSQILWTFYGFGALVFTALVGMLAFPIGLLFPVAALGLLLGLIILPQRTRMQLDPLWRRCDLEAQQLPITPTR